MLERDKERMGQLMEQSTIREKIDTDFVNDLMIEIREASLPLHPSYGGCLHGIVRP